MKPEEAIEALTEAVAARTTETTEPADNAMSTLAQTVAAIANKDPAVFQKYAATPEEATPEKPFVSFKSATGKRAAKANAALQDAGLTLDDVVPNENNVIGTKEINKAIKDNAGRVSSEASDMEDTLVEFVNGIGDDVEQADVRKILEERLNASDIDHDTDDILRMYDAINQDIEARAVEDAELTKLEDALIRQFKPNNNEKGNIRAYMKRLLEADEEGEPSMFTKEMAQRLATLVQIKKRYMDTSIPEGEIPTIKLGGRRVKIRQALSKVRLDPQAYQSQQKRMGTGAAIEQASNLTTAGRNNNGKIQSFLRTGARLNKADMDRTEHKSLLERNEDFFLNKNKFDEVAAINQAAANARANAKGTKIVFEGSKNKTVDMTADDYLPSIIPFTAARSTQVETMRGKVNVPAGTIVYADGITQRVYDSESTVAVKRGDVVIKTDKTPLMKSDVVVVDNPAKPVDETLSEGYIVPEERLKRNQPKVSTSALMNPEIGNRLVILKHTDEPIIRIMSPAQARNNYTIEMLAGDKGLADSVNGTPGFEVRYIQTYQRPATKQTFEELMRVWDNSERFYAFEGEGELGGIFHSGNATGIGFPASEKSISKIELKLSKLTDQQVLALDRRSTKPTSERKSLTIAQVISFIQKTENAPLPKTENDMAVLISDLEQMHLIVRDTIPSGYVKSTIERAQAASDIEVILNKVSAEEGVAAAKLIENLGGDRSRAPKVVEGDGSFKYDSETNEIAVQTTSAQTAHTDLLHGVSEWAYENILTPEDRVEFWRALKKQIVSGDTKLLQDLKSYKPNQRGAAGRIFSDNFVSWALEKRSAGLFENKSYWQKVQRYIKGIFDRYFTNKPIEPSLESLFAKILPDFEMQTRKFDDFANPRTRAGRTYAGFAGKLVYAEELVTSAITRHTGSDPSDEAVVNAFEELRRVIASGVAEQRRPFFKNNTLYPFRKYEDILRGRLADINEILSGKPFIEESKASDAQLRAQQEGIVKTKPDPSKTAPLLIDIWNNGHKNFTPTTKAPTKNVNPEFTSVQYATQLMHRIIKQAYKVSESSELGSKPMKFKTKSRSKAALRAINKGNAEQAKARAAAAAIRTGKEKGLAKRTGTGDDPYTQSLRGMTQPELEQAMLDADGTAREEQVAFMMLEKDNLRFDEGQAKPVPIPDDIGRMQQGELLQVLRDAIYDGDSDMIDIVLWNNTRRIQRNKFRKNNPTGLMPKILENTYLRERIKAEIDASGGTPTAAGIPPNAPFSVRNILSYLTHRDPTINYTQRTMAYRMMNLMGKATRDVLDDTNIMSATDMARLAGVDPAGVKNASMDFRGDQFKKFRADTRRLAIGLTKGNSNPFDVIHEIAHTVVRAGMLPKKEMEAVVQLYRSADDKLKSRINNDYANKYPDASEAQMELILAEEWFAESLAKYMGERVARGDILEALNSGDLSSLSLKNSFHTAIDRAREFVAYIVNGLIGRKDIKQQFRQLMFYGDMFETNSKAPLATLGRRGRAVSPTYAHQYASDVIRHSTPARMAAIKKYTGGGKFSENENGPITYYHATPNGKAFDRETNPDVVMSNGDGAFGPGTYVSPDAQTLDVAYARRATIGAMSSMISRSNLSDEMKSELQDAALELGQARSQISQKRREYAAASDEMDAYDMSQEGTLGGIRFDDLDDESKDLIMFERNSLAKTKDDIQAELDDLLLIEQSIEDLLTQHGMVAEPLVMPLYTRMLNTADFSTSAEHYLGGPFLQAVFRRMVDTGLATEDALSQRLVMAPKENLNGDEAYKFLAKLIEETSGGSRVQSKSTLNSMLEEMGYDSLKTTHMSTISDRDMFGDMSEEGARLGSAKLYDAFVLFSPEQAKHIEAKHFDHEDARIYYRETPAATKGFNGAMTVEMASGNFDKAEPAISTQFLDNLEANGAEPDLVDAMGSIMRQRILNPREEKAIAKTSPMGFLSRQSSNMERMGMNWMGGWYRDHFPNMNQTFASKFMPLYHSMKRLPDAGGKATNWFKKSQVLVGMGEPKQPKSHTRIMKALRFGLNSRYGRNLSTDEYDVATKIRQQFNDEHQNMRDAGMFVGFRRDYVPQVWVPEKIRENEGEFRDAMRAYFFKEKTAEGKVVTRAEADEFVDGITDTLAGLDNDDGIMTGSFRGSSTTPAASSVDYSRMIELEKHPEIMELMDKFLENDLETMLVKYFESSSRRLLHVEKFGLNSHGVSDYMLAAEKGRKGIAKLLSTNKEYVKNFRVVDGDGVEEVDLKETTLMPFSSAPERANEFVDALVDVYNSPAGAPAARDMLDKIAPRIKGEVPLTYQRRADAIMGALSDFKGEPTEITRDAYGFLENAMRVARKQPINGGAANGKAMLQTSRTLRSINNVTLLGFTTLTSLGDLVLPIIRSQSFSSWAKAQYNLASDPDYARAMKEMGVAMENIVHDRMIHMYGGVDSKMSNAFFNATMLTPWTDMNRKMAGAVGYEAFKMHQAKTQKHYKPNTRLENQSRAYKIAYRQLSMFGLQDYAKGQRLGDTSLSDRSLLDTDKALRMGVLKFANQSVFQPNADDVPLWAQTPTGALLFQLKSFPLMMQRMAGDVINEAYKHGNFKPLMYFLTLGPAAGAGTLAIKDVVQMRGGEDEKSAEVRVRNAAKFMGYDEKVHGNVQNFWGWYLEGLLQMGGFGLIADVLHSAASQVDNGAYGQQRIWSTLLGPTYGLGNSAITMAAGAKDAAMGSTPSSNAKERSAAREFASRIPVVGGIRSAREGITDRLAGEVKGSSNGFKSGFSNAFK